MDIVNTTENSIWWLAYNTGSDIYHFDKLDPGLRVSTAQPNLEQFQTELELKARVDYFKGEGYYSSSSLGL
jgi:hypothetical protein